MLRIRPFQKGIDEQLYVKVFNGAFSTYDDLRSVTLEEARTLANAPSFNLDGLLLGEWDGQTAGMVQAHVDKHRMEKKGFVMNLAVLPDHRRRGIARELLRSAISLLKEKGMKVASAWAQTDRLVCTHLYESFGFERVRTSSLMKRILVGHPRVMDEDESTGLREAQLADEEEIALITRLENDAFKEHFNYRPMTVEEMKYLLR
jgi:ribosomal protein S18 acetylase RimI-like enzyme